MTLPRSLPVLAALALLLPSLAVGQAPPPGAAPANAGSAPAAPRPLAPAALTAVPYAAWDNRSAGPMRVWLASV